MGCWNEKDSVVGVVCGHPVAIRGEQEASKRLHDLINVRDFHKPVGST